MGAWAPLLPRQWRTVIVMILLTMMGVRAAAQAPDAGLEESPLSSDRSAAQLSFEADTMAPLWGGALVGLRFFERVKIFGGPGVVPRLYSNTMGDAVSSTSHNSALGEIVRAAFETNESWLAGVEYDFSGRTGFGLGVAFHHLSSAGDTDLNTVGEAANVDLRALSALMTANGLSTRIRLESNIDSGWIYAQYAWGLSDHFSLTLKGGIMQILQAHELVKVGFSTGDLDRLLLEQSERQLEKELKEKGLAPLIGVSVAWTL